MPDATAEAAATPRSRDWFAGATRWAQLTLAEDDPVRFDPAFWIDAFERTRANAVCLSAGGYVAYYPSRVPLHHVSRHIGDGDPFGALVRGARDLGMHVMARVDPHAIHDDAAAAHPEWVAVDAAGAPRRHWAYPSVWVTCAYGDYNTTLMLDVVREIVRDYDVDAIFANRWQGHGVCYCATCVSRFGAASGMALPRVADAADPTWRAWTAWRRDVLSRMIALWDDAVTAIRPHARFIPNMGGASLIEFDLALIERYCPFIVVDEQGRRGTQPLWMAGRNGKRIRATFHDRPVILIASIGPEEEHRWKDAVTTGPEIEGWLANGVAHGMRPWFTKFNGVVPDRRWLDPVAAAFARHEALEPLLAATAPAAEIAVIDPATTLRHCGPEQRAEAERHELGLCHALVEARLPFEMLSDQMLVPQRLDRFRVVALANARCLSDAQCAALEAYVARGGSIVAAFETATCDEHGAPRGALGLGALLGATLTAPARGPVRNAYVALGAAHPINAGFDGAARIMGGTRLMAVEAAADVATPFLFVPDFPDLPMEEVYPREAPRGAAMLARSHPGGGRTVYAPWNLGAVFWDVMAADHARLIANMLRWALPTRPRVALSGRGVIDMALREGPDGLAVILHNLTNPMMMKGPLRETWASGPLSLSVALPAGASAATARLVLAGRDVAVTVADGRAEIAVGAVDTLEAVALRWS